MGNQGSDKDWDKVLRHKAKRTKATIIARGSEGDGQRGPPQSKQKTKMGERFGGTMSRELQKTGRAQLECPTECAMAARRAGVGQAARHREK